LLRNKINHNIEEKCNMKDYNFIAYTRSPLTTRASIPNLDMDAYYNGVLKAAAVEFYPTVNAPDTDQDIHINEALIYKSVFDLGLPAGATASGNAVYDSNYVCLRQLNKCINGKYPVLNVGDYEKKDGKVGDLVCIVHNDATTKTAAETIATAKKVLTDVCVYMVRSGDAEAVTNDYRIYTVIFGRLEFDEEPGASTPNTIAQVFTGDGFTRNTDYGMAVINEESVVKVVMSC
jgi:hypothetical protein